jgi:hypothetical protein
VSPAAGVRASGPSCGDREQGPAQRGAASDGRTAVPRRRHPPI